MPRVARGSPSLMVVSGALWSPLSGAAAGWPCRPPRAHLPVGAAPPAAGAAIACLCSWLAGAGGAGAGRAASLCRMPALPLSAALRGATMRPASARSSRTTWRWSTPGLGRHHISEPASRRGAVKTVQSRKYVSVQFIISIQSYFLKNSIKLSAFRSGGMPKVHSPCCWEKIPDKRFSVLLF